jgi:kynureninase
MGWKRGFSKFLEADPARLHFAAHSHHYWPDVSFAAQQQAWLDAARFVDDKWDHIFEEVLPAAQRHVAHELALPSPDSLVFAPNTHEFVLRLLSCFSGVPRVVTSDSEFHSFERQCRRLEEEGAIAVTRVASEPFATFSARLGAAARGADLVFVSQVFFNSGAALANLDGLVDLLPRDAMIVIDGYHGFTAVPTNLRHVGARAFYLAGGYKYAMAGEGACFLHVPPVAAQLRPRNTGWFAAFGALDEKVEGRVPYADGAARFMGATFDPSGLYRLNAVMAWRAREGLTSAKNQAHAHALQRRFVDGLKSEGEVSAGKLVVSLDDPHRGQFLTFRTADARALCATLKLHQVVTDARGDRLRFGFGPYHDEADVDELLRRLQRAGV